MILKISFSVMKQFVTYLTVMAQYKSEEI